METFTGSADSPIGIVLAFSAFRSYIIVRGCFILLSILSGLPAASFAFAFLAWFLPLSSVLRAAFRASFSPFRLPFSATRSFATVRKLKSQLRSLRFCLPHMILWNCEMERPLAFKRRANLVNA
jgi:hypothetical protein